MMNGYYLNFQCTFQRKWKQKNSYAKHQKEADEISKSHNEKSGFKNFDTGYIKGMKEKEV